MAIGSKKYLEGLGATLLIVPPTLAILLTIFVVFWELLS